MKPLGRLPTFYAIDPGYKRSAWVLMRGLEPLGKGILPNEDLLAYLVRFRHRIVVEMVASFGMPVGEEVFETVFWIGRFCEVASAGFERIKRIEIKKTICHNASANDANIRRALIDLYGPEKHKAIGLKASPGPLYGFKRDMWSALAVGVAWLRLRGYVNG